MKPASASIPDPSSTLWILVPRSHVAIIKSFLQQKGNFDRHSPLIKDQDTVQKQFHPPQNPFQSEELNGEASSVVFALPTTILGSAPTELKAKQAIFAELGLSSIREDIGLALWLANRCAPVLSLPSSTQKDQMTSAPKNGLVRAISNWYANLEPGIRSAFREEESALLKGNWRYHRYPPLLVLPAGTFSRELWTRLFHALPRESEEQLCAEIAVILDVTHIVEQAPIPATVAREKALITEPDSTKDGCTTNADLGTHYLTEKTVSSTENVLRSPVGLRPLFGDFGNTVGSAASPEAFFRALWVTVQQNGILQVFAPLHSMFANGNVNEKRRVRDFAAADLRDSGFSSTYNGLGGAAAVDLYAGIGYFAFSYAKAGYRPVLCWELNAWSIEGLRRGAALNRWTCQTVTEDKHIAGEDSDDLDVSLLVFNENNAKALQRIESLRSRLPPIRHVNCGYLPSSALSWADAVHMLDPALGGWVHAHENCAVADIEQRAVEIASLMRVAASSSKGSVPVQVQCTHVERVKSYAPGVMHCVFDVLVRPESSSMSAEDQ